MSKTKKLKHRQQHSGYQREKGQGRYERVKSGGDLSLSGDLTMQYTDDVF